MTIEQYHNTLRNVETLGELAEQVREIAAASIERLSISARREGPRDADEQTKYVIDTTVENAMGLAQTYEQIMDSSVGAGGRRLKPLDILQLIMAATIVLEEEDGSTPEATVLKEASRSLGALISAGLPDSPGLSGATKALVLATESAKQSGVTLVTHYLESTDYANVEQGEEAQAIGTLIAPIIRTVSNMVAVAIQDSPKLALLSPEPDSQWVH